MVKNLNYKKILILSTPISFLVGPLILEIILIITSITFLYDEKKETLKNNLNNIFFKFFLGLVLIYYFLSLSFKDLMKVILILFFILDILFIFFHYII